MIAHPNLYLISPMTTTPRLQRISEADLDGLIAELRRQGTTELILLGSDIEIKISLIFSLYQGKYSTNRVGYAESQIANQKLGKF